MLHLKKYFYIVGILCISFTTIYLNGCNDNNISDSSNMTDDEYIRTIAINTAFSSDSEDDDNLFAGEVSDFDSDGPVSNASGFDTPIDSLLKWGRRVSSVNVNAEITSTGDSLKNVLVTRTISGNFIITGYINGNLDSTIKPYTQQQKRSIVFRRTQRRGNPRLNWRVYQYSAVDGNTTLPQTGKDNIIMNKVEYYKNNDLLLTLYGPDFTSNIFTAGFFGSNGMYDINRGDNIKAKVYLTSNQSDTDIVSYHWSRNSFGFHRESFVMISQTPNGSGYDRVFEKTFEIYPQHNHGRHNAFISANTKSSLYDNSPSLFSSTYMGFPYRVRH